MFRFFVLLVFALAWFATNSCFSANQTTLVSLPEPISAAKLSGAGRVICGTENGSVYVFDGANGSLLYKKSVPHAISEIALSHDETWAFMAGAGVNKISRLDINSGLVQTVNLPFTRARLQKVPVLSVDSSGALLISGVGYSDVAVLPNDFWKVPGGTPPLTTLTLPAELNGLYASYSLPVFYITLSTRRSVVALRRLDADPLDVFDFYLSDRSHGDAKTLVTSVAAETEDHDNSFIAALDPENVIVLLDFNAGLGKFYYVAQASIDDMLKENDSNSQTSRKPDKGVPEIRSILPSELLVSADLHQKLIAVTSRTATNLGIFARVGRVLEKRGYIKLEDTPQLIDVASTGGEFLVLNSTADKITVLHDLDKWEFGPPDPLAERIKSVQRKLANSGFSISLVDGVIGPETHQAIAKFQKTAGLKATGELDAETLARIMAYQAN